MADTIKPRLEKAGADCGRAVYIVDHNIALTLEDGRIETAIKETNACLFIVDPLQAFIPPDADMLNAAKIGPSCANWQEWRKITTMLLFLSVT